MGFISGNAGGGTLDGTKLIFTTAVVADADVTTTVGYQTGKKYLECAWAGTGITKVANGSGQVILMLRRTGSAWSSTGLLYSFGDAAYTINGSVGSFNAAHINATPAYLGMAIDFTNSKIWVGSDSSGPFKWNEDVIANQDPASNIGGQSFSAILNSTPVFFGVAPRGDIGDTVTLNVGPTWHYALPSGFTAW
jgi:hypothetical protein